MTDIVTARSDLMNLIDDTWSPTGFELHWPGVASKSTPPSTLTVWGRAVLNHATGGSTTIGSATGKKRYEHTGTAIIQVFGPLGKGGKEAYDQVKTLLDAFQVASPTTNGVTIFNVRVNEIGSTDIWFQVNVLFDFRYDQVL